MKIARHAARLGAPALCLVGALAGAATPSAFAARALSGVELLAGPVRATAAPEARFVPGRGPEAEAARLLGTTLAGLTDAELVVGVALPEGSPETLSVILPHQDAELRLELELRSVRADGYELLADVGHGQLIPIAPGPVNTYRGTVAGRPGSLVSGAYDASGLHLRIDLGDGGERLWVQPVERNAPGHDFGAHLLYADGQCLPHDFVCGTPSPVIDPILGDPDARERPGGNPVEGDFLCITELACDADFEYFQDYGSVAAVEARINSVISTMNTQYETEVDITHEITTIIVRTNSNDPYMSSGSFDLLCEFITEWSNNQPSVVRDVAQLFTGRNVSGGTIGRAADIGDTGICVNQGGCSGGTFDTFGSYSFVESDFNGNFSCATDLSAHELGHLWGAFHCSCSSFTMNPSITCANQFTSGSINSIIDYRNTRTCLECPGQPPSNDRCSDSLLVPANYSDTIDTTDATPPAGTVDTDLPDGTPSCQWDGMPTDVHNTVWYRFEAVDSSVEIVTCDSTDVQDTIIAVYEGFGCPSLVEIGCSEDDCGPDGRLTRLCLDGLQQGTVYTVMIGNPGGNPDSLPGEIELTITSPCPDIGSTLGACCLPDGNCIEGVTASNCFGTFLGVGTTCADVDCDNIEGACCLPDGSCGVLDPGTCDLIGGTFLGPGTGCDDCAPPPACPADFDGDEIVGFGDLVQLLSVWGPCDADCPEDLDADEDVGFGDLVELLSAWGPCD